MTVSTESSKVEYTATVGVYIYGFNFKILADADIKLYINGVLKTLNTHYTVTGAGNESGGSVVIGSSYVTAGNTVLIKRVVPLTQGTDFVENDALPAQSLENGLDKSIMAAQQLQEALNRAIKLADYSTKTPPFLKDPPTAPNGEMPQLATSGAFTFLKWIADPVPTTQAAQAAAEAAKTAAQAAQAAAEAAKTAAQTSETNAAASAATVPTPTTIQKQDYNYATTTGSANTYVLTLSPVPTVNPKFLTVKWNATNTASSTINVNGIGAVNIKTEDGANPAAGVIVSGQVNELIYDGTNYILVGISGAKPQAVVHSGTNNFTGAVCVGLLNTVATAAGGTDAYAATLAPAITSLTTNAIYSVIPDVSNTGACTLNLNGIGVKNIKTPYGADPDNFSIVANRLAVFRYDGTNMVLLNNQRRVICVMMELPATDLVASTTYISFLAPFAGSIVEFRADVSTAGTTNVSQVDLKKNGTTVFSTIATIDSAETSTTTAATLYVLKSDGTQNVVTGDTLTLLTGTLSTTVPKGLTVQIVVI